MTINFSLWNIKKDDPMCQSCSTRGCKDVHLQFQQEPFSNIRGLGGVYSSPVSCLLSYYITVFPAHWASLSLRPFHLLGPPHFGLFSLSTSFLLFPILTFIRFLCASPSFFFTVHFLFMSEIEINSFSPFSRVLRFDFS